MTISIIGGPSERYGSLRPTGQPPLTPPDDDEKETLIQSIMAQKPVTREVAEAEYNAFC
jgi:hypothetical protein